MRKIFISLIIVVFMSGLFSCRSNRDLVYLRDMNGFEQHIGLPGPVPYYRIKTNDNLYVNIQTLNPEVNQLFNPVQGVQGAQQIYAQPSGQYLNGYHVDSRGNIVLPIIGSVALAGLTIDEAQNIIQKKANEYLKEATVRVKLLSYKVTVMGEVKSPGVYYNYNNNFTVLEAISMANGITDYAGIKKVLVVRPTAKGSKSYRLDLSSKQLLASEAFFLQPNDVVYVQPERAKNFRLNTPVYSLFLSTVTTLLVILRFMND